MTAHQCFVDSNIIIYAHDEREKIKNPIAQKHLSNLWASSPLYPFISIQVLQECFATFIRKKVPFSHAHGIIELYSQWNVIDNDRRLLLEGMRIQHHYQISIWDALIVAAAKKANASHILSENLNVEQKYEGIKIINPFIDH